MADYDWPLALPPELMVWSIQKAGVSFRSPYAGTLETVTFPGWFWKISVTVKPSRTRAGLTRDSGVSEGFFEGLAGGENAVRVVHWLRPVPNGTLRGSPTVATAAARGDLTLAIATAGSLAAGDLFKVGSAVYKAQSDCYSSAGVLTVPLVARVRVALAVGAPVVWDHPFVRCIMPALTHGTSYSPGVMSGAAVDLEEAP